MIVGVIPRSIKCRASLGVATDEMSIATIITGSEKVHLQRYVCCYRVKIQLRLLHNAYHQISGVHNSLVHTKLDESNFVYVNIVVLSVGRHTTPCSITLQLW